MFQHSNSAERSHRSKMTLHVTCMIASLLLAASAHAQNNFNSGSTGADGALAPASNQTLQVPASGVFNYTTINIPAGVTITFTRNAANTPVTILASGNVTIAGSLVITGQAGAASGAGGSGGPGGFDGGMGGFGLPIYAGNPGQGPGGGGSGKTGSSVGGGGGGGFNVAGTNGGGSVGSFGTGGPKYSTNTLLPLIGGSGGGGGAAATNARGASGGGGGGAILLASSGTIAFTTATINAQGGAGGTAPNSSSHGAGGGGAGGGIRIVANTISGAATLNVNGGAGGNCWNGGCGGAGGLGYVRVEAYDYTAFTVTGGSPNNLSFATPNPVTLPTAPQLRVASVAGINSPVSPLGSFQAVPDIVVPASQANPVTVALEAANIPLGTVVQVSLIPAFGTRTTVSSSALTGTEAASTASASLTLPSGMSVIGATVVVDLTLAKVKPMFIDGERVRSYEVAAVFGARSEVTYITESGRRIKRADE